MNEQSCIKIFEELFAGFFAELGFDQRTELNFYRHKPGVEHRIGFHVLEQERDGILRIVGGAGVRLPTIDAIIRPGRESEQTITIGKPLHLLRPDQEYRPWAFVNRHELEALRPAIMDEVRQYALPFFERYGDYASVLTALRSESPRDWFLCTSDSRDTVLVADALLTTGKDEALKLGHELLKKYTGKMPKYSKALRELVGRIEKIGV